MYSKRSLKPKAKAKTVEFKRKWLKDKVDSAKSTYDETLSAFKQRLDDVVAKTFENAARLMEEANEDIFLQQVFDVGTQLEQCNSDLFDLSLMCYSADSDASDHSDDESEPKLPASDVNHVTEASSPDASSSRKCSPIFSSPEPINHNISTISQELEKNFEIYKSSSNSSSTTDLCLPVEPTPQPVVNERLNYTNSSPAVVSTSLPSDSTPTSSPVNKTVPSPRDSLDIGLPPYSENISFANQSSPLTQHASPAKTSRTEISSSPSSKPVSFPSQDEIPTFLSPNENIFGQFYDHHLIQSSEVDLLLLHNIQREKKVELLVTDVKNPSFFSVQPVECHDQVVEMQHSINDMYSKDWTSKLHFTASPKVGTICVSLFTDQFWYRAKIIGKLKDGKYEIMYIDYGNHSVVEEDSLRTIAPSFANIPKMSIQCSLHGIEPAACLGASSSKGVDWTVNCMHWFDSHVYNKRFIGKFADAPAKAVNDPVYSVHLFTVNRTSDGVETIWNVADGLVCMGFASHTEKPGHFQDTDEETDETPAKSVFDPMFTEDLSQENSPSAKPAYPDYRSLIDVKPMSRSGHVHNAVPAGMETGADLGGKHQRKITFDLMDGARRAKNKPQARARSEMPKTEPEVHPAPSLSSLSVDLHRSGSGCDVDDPSNETLATWNPMQDDFVSERNRYSIDVDNACVAVENFDPSKVQNCKYFEKGDCWKGVNCDRPHIKREKGVLRHAQVLSGHMLDQVELISHEKVVVKITTRPKNSDFYAQVISKDFSQSNIAKQRCVLELESITDDMKRFYSKNRAKLSFDGKLCIGEMCAVVSDRTFCRAFITEISESNERIQIFLVDYGNKLWTNRRDLLPLSVAFMHTPAQAVQCTYDEASSAVSPVKTHCYLARVGDATTLVDSPVPLTFLAEV